MRSPIRVISSLVSSTRGIFCFSNQSIFSAWQRASRGKGTAGNLLVREFLNASLVFLGRFLNDSNIRWSLRRKSKSEKTYCTLNETSHFILLVFFVSYQVVLSWLLGWTAWRGHFATWQSRLLGFDSTRLNRRPHWQGIFPDGWTFLHERPDNE